MKNYFILHGSFSSPKANWFPWLAEEIEKTKPQNEDRVFCCVPQMPVGVGYQNYKNWEAVMLAYAKAGVLNLETTIFAHSIAPAFVCKFLITHKIKVKRLVFVCGFNNYLGIDQNYDAVNESMYIDDIERVKKYCTDIICLYSDNDPYVRFEKEREFADRVADKRILIQNGGHLNSESGYTEFNKLKEFI